MTEPSEMLALADRIDAWSPDTKSVLVFIARERRMIADALRAVVALSLLEPDWHAESIKLYRQNRDLRNALQEQHDWHLAQGERDFGDGVKLNMADEYADSSMYERTTAVLSAVLPTGIAGYETWKASRAHPPAPDRANCEHVKEYPCPICDAPSANEPSLRELMSEYFGALDEVESQLRDLKGHPDVDQSVIDRHNRASIAARQALAKDKAPAVVLQEGKCP